MLERLEEPAPPVGHSISAASTSASRKGSTSPGGVLTPCQQPARKQKVQWQALKRSTATQQLEELVMSQLDQIRDILSEGDTFREKVEKASLRDITIAEGVLIDKLQELRGQTTRFITVQHQTKLDELVPAMLEVMKQRGLPVPMMPPPAVIVNPP